MTNIIVLLEISPVYFLFTIVIHYDLGYIPIDRERWDQPFTPVNIYMFFEDLTGIDAGFRNVWHW